MSVKRYTKPFLVMTAFMLALVLNMCPTFAKDKTPLPADVDVAAAGPMVGHTTDDSSAIWMYAPANKKVEVICTNASDQPQKVTLTQVPTKGLELRGRAWLAKITGLTSNTRYRYEVLFDGESDPSRQGTFLTAPIAGEPTRFRLGLTSCMVVKHPQDSWNLFAKDKPDLHLTLGDTTYADSTDPRVQWRYHLRYRRVAPFANVLRTTPTYAMWDDHDYGPNNSDREAAGKEQSLEAWQRIWVNPGAGIKHVPGAFYQFSRGDVDFFVVDGRYHRSPNKDADDENKTMLGVEQRRWLIEKLKNSKAKFKIIATGSTLHHSLNDGMRLYTHERHLLFRTIKEHQIPGVVFMTGSLHRSLVWEHHESDLAGYPVVEIISSGIANSKQLSYATIDFDTTVNDPTMTVRIVYGTGKVVENKTWKLSALSHE